MMATTLVFANQATSRSVQEGVYTTVQADQGQNLYDAKCRSCHGAMTSIVPDMAPLLNDFVFRETWKNRTVGEFFERIRDTMPQNEPGTLSPSELANLIAYILRANELPAGEIALPAEVEPLNQILMTDGLP